MSDVKGQIWTGESSGAPPSFTNINNINYQPPTLAKTPGDSQSTLYTFVATKDGYIKNTHEELIEVNEEPLELCLSEERFLEAYVLDNQSLEGKVGVVEIGDETYVTDENGYVKIELFDKTDEQLREYYETNSDGEIIGIKELKAYTVDPNPELGERNSFIQTYKNVDVTAEPEKPTGLMVTTGNKLWTDDVDEQYKMDEELFRLFAQYGVFGLIGSPAHGLRGILWENAGKEITHEKNNTGYEIVIDSDNAYKYDPENYGEFTREQQQYIANVIEREINDKIEENGGERLRVRLAEPGEVLKRKEGEEYLRFADGLVVVTSDPTGNGYRIANLDYEPKDGVLDSAIVYVGDPPTRDGAIAEETGSIIIQNNIFEPSLEGKSIQARGGGKLSPADLKMQAIQRNMSMNDRSDYTINVKGENVDISKLNYKPLTKLDNICGN